jgi:hypothetical protein
VSVHNFGRHCLCVAVVHQHIQDNLTVKYLQDISKTGFLLDARNLQSVGPNRNTQRDKNKTFPGIVFVKAGSVSFTGHSNSS